MTWHAVLIAGSILAAVIPFALLGGWWLAYMAQRTYSFWPLFVFFFAAFWYAVGLAAIVVVLS